jgi:hypothetical protein
MFFKSDQYLINFKNEIMLYMPDDIYSCDIYSGPLDAFSDSDFVFKANVKSQLYLNFDKMDNHRKISGQTRVDAYFGCFVVTAIDKKMAELSMKGLEHTQKVIKFITNRNDLTEKQLGTTIEVWQNVVNNPKLAKLYNIHGIYFKVECIVEY